MLDIQYPDGADLVTRRRLYDEHVRHLEAERARIRAEQAATRQAEIELARQNGKRLRPETSAEEARRADAYQAAVEPAQEGGRYQACLSLCGKFAGTGFTETAAWDALVAFGRRCEPPMTEADLRDKRLDKWLEEIIAPITRSIVVEAPRTTSAAPRAGAPPGDPETEPSPEPSYDIRHAQQRDWGHALELWGLCTDQLRWANHRPAWMEFDGRRWQVVPESRAMTLAAEALRLRYATELADCHDTDRSKALAGRIVDTCVASRMAAGLKFYSGQYPVLVLRAEEWDAHPWLLNVHNGTLDLTRQMLGPHDPSALLTRCTLADYDPGAEAPAWSAHIQRFLPDDEVRRQVQRDLGRSLVGTTLEECLPIWYGTGANGKTTTSRVLSAVLGDYAAKTAPDLLVEHKNEQHPTAIADLVGARLAFAVEVDERARLAETLVKDLTGGDRLKTRYMRGDFFEAERSFDIVLIGNHQPAIHSTDDGIWRRIRLIPWAYRIPDEEQHPQDEVIHELLTESAGILNWMLDGLRDWQADHHWIANVVIAGTAAYRDEQDILAEYLADRCEFGDRYQVAVAELYDNYVGWCKTQHPISKRTFGDRLRGRGITSIAVGHTRTRTWIGVRLAPDEPSF